MKLVAINDDRLYEMSLKHGSFRRVDSGRGFHDRDRRTLEKMVWHKRLSRVLSSSDYDFNVIFMELDQSETDDCEAIEKFCASQQIPLDGRITFVKRQSNDGQPLTAWMVLHCFGHAMTDHDGGLEYTVSQLMYALADSYVDEVARRSGYSSYDMPSDMAYKILHHIFQFKSARDYHKTRKLVGDGRDEEMVHELIADYVWHGKIRWRQPDAALAEKFGSPWVGADIGRAVGAMESRIKQALDRVVGQIVVDDRS